MMEIVPIEAHEYDLAFRIMRENMEVYHQQHDLPWDQDWIEANYLPRENYSIFCSGNWRGFMSLEWHDRELFIHTLQLTKEAQGGIYGYRVYQWLLGQMAARGKTEILCKTFRDSPMSDLYKRLGFAPVRQEGILVTLQKSVNEHDGRGLA